MKKTRGKVVISFLALLFTFNLAQADFDFDVSDLFSLNTAFDEHNYSATSNLFSLNTAFNERSYTAFSNLFDLNTAFQPDDRIVVAFEEGWNLISINITPPEEFWVREEGPNIIRMMNQLRIDEDNHHVEMMKDEDGRFYLPAWGFNNIPYWNLTQGYQVKIDDEGLSTTWYGEPIEADVDVPLFENWNIAAYFPTYELDASAPHFYVLSPIIDDLIAAKNNDGQFIAPAFGFSNMPPWRESQGYMIKMESDLTLNYPVEQDERLLASTGSQLCTPASEQHWRNPVQTGANLSLLVCLEDDQAADGDQIAVFSTEGRVVGSGTVNDCRCGIAVWGDDDHTETIDGLREAEAFTLKLWNADRRIEQPLTVDNFLQGSSLTYTSNDLLAISVVIEAGIPDDYFMESAYPNPFNSVVRLTYGLPQASRVTLQVYDVEGRLVTTITNNTMPAGYHTALWNGSEISSGSYFVRMETTGFSDIRKVTLVK